MATTTTTLGKLGRQLDRLGSKLEKYVHHAMYASARKCKTIVKAEGQKKGMSSRGDYQKSWDAEKTKKGGVLGNTSEHALIVEKGSKPHKVGGDGIDELAKWAKAKGLRKGKGTYEQLAFAIANKIEKKGTLGKYILRDALKKFHPVVDQEITKALRKASK